MTLAQNGGDDAQLRDLQGKMIAHCEGAGDRMAILDAPPNLLPQDILEWRMNTAGYDSKFATLYYPWIEVMDPLTNQPMLVPPSGHVAGVWARTDATRGVHKAPANEVVLGVNGLGFQVTQARAGRPQQGRHQLHPRRSRAAASASGARARSRATRSGATSTSGGSSTTSSESIMEGTQWAVFEPNDERLWMQLRIAASNFLTRVWREGALFGATPEQAFFVKCDAETNPPEVIEAGQVIFEIGIAPVKPAEFVVFRLSQFTAAAPPRSSGVTARARERRQLDGKRQNRADQPLPAHTRRQGGDRPVPRVSAGSTREHEIVEQKEVDASGNPVDRKVAGQRRSGRTSSSSAASTTTTALWEWRDSRSRTAPTRRAPTARSSCSTTTAATIATYSSCRRWPSSTPASAHERQARTRSRSRTITICHEGCRAECSDAQER